MCDVIIWHGQNRNLCNRSGTSLYDSGTLIQCCKFAVEITRITFTGRNLTFRGGNFTHRLAEGGDIGQDNKDVHAFFECQIFSCGKCNLRSQKSFNDRVVCQIQKHNNVVGSTTFFKCTAKKFCDIVFDTHGSKYDREVFIGVTAEGSLLYDLCSQFVVRKTVS